MAPTTSYHRLYRRQDSCYCNKGNDDIDVTGETKAGSGTASGDDSIDLADLLKDGAVSGNDGDDEIELEEGLVQRFMQVKALTRSTSLPSTRSRSTATVWMT